MIKSVKCKIGTVVKWGFKREIHTITKKNYKVCTSNSTVCEIKAKNQILSHKIPRMTTSDRKSSLMCDLEKKIANNLKLQKEL